jgi:hypothetical protein
MGRDIGGGSDENRLLNLGRKLWTLADAKPMLLNGASIKV